MHLDTRPIPRRVALTGAAPLAATTAVPQASAAAAPDDRTAAGGGLSAVIRYTENGITHVLARDHARLGFGTGRAQAADQVCVLADGFVTVAGERSRRFGADAAPDAGLRRASEGRPDRDRGNAREEPPYGSRRARAPLLGQPVLSAGRRGQAPPHEGVRVTSFRCLPTRTTSQYRFS
ncbi:penicillin acylase family protein [Streptomyces nojiriensis]|uniref:penicillin acylase family protein n=1 Tax=Streptomyces nojiriensis TaxID=66374 RepID=UPI00399B9A4F